MIRPINLRQETYNLYNNIKQKFCKHENLKFYRNIYGDEINRRSTNNKIYRSIWICKDCGKVIYKEDLNGEKEINL